MPRFRLARSAARRRSNRSHFVITRESGEGGGPCLFGKTFAADTARAVNNSRLRGCKEATVRAAHEYESRRARSKLSWRETPEK